MEFASDGMEMRGIGTGAFVYGSSTDRVPTEHVPLWALADFVDTAEVRSALVIGHHGQLEEGREGDEGKPILDVVKVDTEGHDPAVVRGAESLFDRQRVRVLVFEYHMRGLWEKVRLLLQNRPPKFCTFYTSNYIFN